MAQLLAALSFWTLVVIGLLGSLGESSAEPIPCPSDLEAALKEAFQTCSEQMQKMESKALLGIANISIGLLKEAPLAQRVVALTEEISSEEIDETKMKRSLLNVSLLKEATPEIRQLSRTLRNSQNKRESQLEKEVGELVVCAVEKLMKDQPVLKKAIEECHPDDGKEDKVSQLEFEECVGTRVKQMCPNLKLN